MRITVESTTKVVTVNGIECRVWEGQTERGVKIQCLISLVAAEKGQDVSQFDAELKEHVAPSSDSSAFPIRMVL